MLSVVKIYHAQMSRVMKDPSSEFPTRPDTNRTVHLEIFGFIKQRDSTIFVAKSRISHDVAQMIIK